MTKICRTMASKSASALIRESGGNISRGVRLERTLRRAPARPRLDASGRSRLVSRSRIRATLFPSPRPATRHAHPLEKAELVKSMMAASARGVACPAQSRVARLSSRRATAVAPAAAPTRARRARSNTVEGTREEGGSPRLAAPRSIAASPFQTAAERDGSRRANSPRFQPVSFQIRRAATVRARDGSREN